MKREIKFKFYHEETETMSKVYTIDELANGRYAEPYNAEDCKKLQYTGFKDNFKAEVWEGDSVQIYAHDFYTHKHEKQTRYVYKSKEGESSTYLLAGEVDDIRIVSFVSGALCLRAYDGCNVQIMHFSQMNRPGHSIKVIKG